MDETIKDQMTDEHNRTEQPSERLEQPREFAGFWMRFWAYLLDVIVVFSINGLLLSPLKMVNDGAPIEIGFWTLTGILSGIVYYVYFVLMTKYFQQTLGKMVFGLKVVPEKDDTLRWTDLLFREVIGRFIYNVAFGLKLLYIVVAFTEEKQGIHDMIGNTRVVHSK